MENIKNNKKINEINNLHKSGNIRDLLKAGKFSNINLDISRLSCKGFSNLLEKAKKLKDMKRKDEKKNILEEKKEELENNKKKYTNELLLLNNDIKEKSSQLENAANDSKVILNKLNQLNSKINEEYQKIKLSEFVNKHKNDNSITNISNKNKIMNSKKLILLNHTIIDKFKIHKEKLEKIVDEDKNTKLINLKNELEELNNNEKELKAEIEKMRLIKDSHELKCIKIIEELEKNLERIKKEYNLENKIKEENKTPSIKKQLSLNNKKITSLPNIYKNIIIPDNEENKAILPKREIPKKQINKEQIIQKNFEELQEQIKNKMKIKSQQNIKNYINSRNEKKKEMENNNLFSSEEKNLLKEFIPMEILNVYQNKFQTIKDENNQIIQILQKNQSKKKLIEEKNQFEFIKDKKEHNIQKKNVELNSKILLVTKNIKKINKEINELQKDLDKINITYNIKKLDNDKFRETWVSFYNDIKNKKIIVKKDETVTEEELKYIDRFGKIPEIENLNLEEKSDKNESDIIILNAT
jgi:hypothetical protein